MMEASNLRHGDSDLSGMGNDNPVGARASARGKQSINQRAVHTASRVLEKEVEQHRHTMELREIQHRLEGGQKHRSGLKKWWRSLNVKTQILGMYGVTVGLSLLLVTGSTLIAVYEVGVETKGHAARTLQGSVADSLVAIGQQMGNSVAAYFTTLLAAVELVGAGMSEAWEAEQHLLPQTNGGVWEESLISSASDMSTLCPSSGLTQLSRVWVPKHVCLSKSSYHLLDVTTTGLAKLSSDSALESVNNKSSLMDYYAAPLWEHHSSVISVYAGMPTGTPHINNSNPVFRQYPGQYRSSSDYNPTVRTWYIDGYNGNGTVITEPYKSSSMGVFEVTVAKAFYANCIDNCSASAFRGVIGFDILISALETQIKSLNIYEGGHAMLYGKDTQTVLVHQYWDHGHTASSVQTVDDLMGPGFFADYAVPSVGKVLEFTLNGTKHLITSSQVPGMAYYISVVAPYNEVYTLSILLDDNVTTQVWEAFITLAIVGVGLALVLMVVAWFVGRVIAAPVISLGGDSGLAQQAIQNARTKRISSGAVESKNWGEKDEIGLLYKEFGAMSRYIDEGNLRNVTR